MKSEQIDIISEGLEPDELNAWIDIGASLLVNDIPDYRIYQKEISHVFAKKFGMSLRLHHIINSNKPLSESNFLVALVNSWRAEGKFVQEPEHHNHKGEDVTKENEGFSLKTETGKKVKPFSMNISKFIEGGWLKDGIFEENHVKKINTKAIEKVSSHLNLYERIWVLRAFQNFPSIQYDLVEIPKDMLAQVVHVKAEDFWAEGCKPKRRVPFTAKLTRHADVCYSGVPDAWQLYLDGSDGKVSLKKVRLELCNKLASWKLAFRGV